MTRSSSRRPLPGCRLMIAIAILGAGLAPLCDADRVARTLKGFHVLADLTMVLAQVGTDIGQPSEDESADASEPDAPANDDDESAAFSSGPILLAERRANPKRMFPLTVWDRVPTLSLRRPAVCSTATTPVKDLPTWLCRWTC